MSYVTCRNGLKLCDGSKTGRRIRVFRGPGGRPAAHAPQPGNLCFGSQTLPRSGRILLPMSVKYYTQFRLTDAWYRGGNEFSGVVELSRPMDQNSDITEIEAALAHNFDLQRSAVKLLSWARLQ